MKKIAFLLVFTMVFTLIGCDKKPDKKMPGNTPATSDKTEDKLMLDDIDKIMADMTLEEKIAQMLIVYYDGYSVDETLVNVIKNVKPGGFILFANNISTYDKTKEFVSALQSNSEIPMIISIDQEGGLVQRMSALTSPNATPIPDMYSVGSTNDLDLAEQIGAVMAKEMRTIGVNTVFAPVVDILSDKSKGVLGKRSFGDTPELVTSMATSLVKGLEDNMVIATYKHFPGLGDTSTDSHLALPIVNKTLEELNRKELIPYKKAIENGAKMIMVGHIALPKITGDNTPASLSKTIVTDILRNQLGYNGLVVTDALNMGALTNNYTYEEIYVKAIEAGCDLLLMPNGSAKAVEIIKKNVSEERINESVRRILSYKCQYLKNYEWLDKSYLGSREHQAIVNKVN